MYKLFKSFSKKNYIYVSENNKFFIIDNNGFQDLPEEGHINNLRLKFPDIIRECGKDDIIEHLPYRNRVPRILAIEVTQQCNMRCEYCIYSGNYTYERVHNSKTMGIETFYNVERRMYAQDNAPPEFVGFYGGEPLLCFDQIKHFHDIIIKREPKTKFAITTNGLLLTDEVIKRLVSDRYYITVSYDGLNHDKYRRDAYGRSTSDIVIDRLKRIQSIDQEFYRTHVRLSVTLAPPYQLREQAKFFNANELTCNMQMNISYVNEFDTSFFDKVNHYNVGRGSSSLIQDAKKMALDLYEDYNGSNFQKYFFLGDLSKINDRPMVEVNNPFPRGNCEFFAHRGFIDVDGNCYACERVGSMGFLGNVNNDIDDSQYIRRLHEKYDEVLQENCSRCYLSRFCGICTARCRKGNDYSPERFRKQCIAERRRYEVIIPLFLSLKEKKLI